MNPYIPLLVVVAIAFLLPVVLLTLSHFMGPKRDERSKGDPYECGVAQGGSSRGRLPIKYYLIAVLFLLFDVEAVFLYPWAVVYRDLGLFGLVEMGIFLSVLVLGLVYVWKRGALEWD